MSDIIIQIVIMEYQHQTILQTGTADQILVSETASDQNNGKDTELDGIDQNDDLRDEDLDENENWRDFYDSEQDDHDENGGHSPINLPQEFFPDEDEDEEEDDQERIYAMCSTGKKTKILGIELYGFFAWNLTSVMFLVFLVWAYVPEQLLNQLGIYYIPSKYTALAVPTWLCMTVWMLLLMYAALSQYMTHPRDSYLSMQDRATILSHPEVSNTQ